jgi:4-amino-4-deoxy-L-arabinose transferase-like glycosyltransferase
LTKPADGKVLSNRWGEYAIDLAPVVALTALAAALRLFSLVDIPPGLYHDEAFNGLDALGILGGEHAIYFAANHGREPLFIYLIAATVGALGRTSGALRLASAVCGTLTVPATYLMVRVWFNKRIAVLSTAIIATTYWHVHLSRVGFRTITLPLAIALTVWVSGRAFHSRRRGTWLLAGIFYGACFYTYVAARFTPVVVLGFAVYLLLAGEKDRLWPGAVAFAAGMLVTLLPLGIYARNHWDVLMGRPGQVSVFNPLINGGDLPGTVIRQLLSTLGMFFLRGDTIPRHNLPGRPVFDPFMGGAMILGTGLAAVRARRRDPGSALTLIWVGLMLVPTWLAEDAPHFLRAVGILPLLVVLPALGLDSVGSWLEERGWQVWASVLMCGVLVISLGATGWDYFVRYAARPETLYAFEDAAADLAAQVNTFLGTGWDGDGMIAPRTSPRADRHVYLDRRVRDEWTSTAFLVPATEQITVFSPDTPPSPSRPGMLVVWPHDGLDAYVSALPRDSCITARAGPLTRGDLEETPYVSYVTYVVMPGARASTGAIAHFNDEIALVDYTIEKKRQVWEVTLEWAARKVPRDNYTVSVRLVDDGQPVAQYDGEPGDGYYPTGLWRPGDLVVDRHTLDVRKDNLSDTKLLVGLYVWPTMEQLEASDPDGVPLGTQVTLPVTTKPPP